MANGRNGVSVWAGEALLGHRRLSVSRALRAAALCRICC